MQGVSNKWCLLTIFICSVENSVWIQIFSDRVYTVQKLEQIDQRNLYMF